MATDAPDLAGEIKAATSRLIDTTSGLDDAQLRAASLLPDWTRGHVLTHVARNADGLTNLLGWTRGDRTPCYVSLQARADDIEAGAGRSPQDMLADLAASADRFATALAAVPRGGWDTVVDWPSGRSYPATRIPWARLVEIELHHVDLDQGYRPSDWTSAFTDVLLHHLIKDLPGRGGAPNLTVHRDGDPEPAADAPRPVVSGTPAALAAWLTGRSVGDDLTVDPPAPLPQLPAWM